ncbi:hypothetical protein VCHENC02_5506B, partial [Vibrio harveyi]
DEIQAIQHKI